MSNYLISILCFIFFFVSSSLSIHLKSNIELNYDDIPTIFEITTKSTDQTEVEVGVVIDIQNVVISEAKGSSVVMEVVVTMIWQDQLG
jgi:hypothetical protein